MLLRSGRFKLENESVLNSELADGNSGKSSFTFSAGRGGRGVSVSDMALTHVISEIGNLY